MDERNRSAMTPALSGDGAKNLPPRETSRGVVHENARHTTQFTVVGNHLAQHVALSLVAIGLATHIQSLPAGSPVDIRSLAARFPEGTTRIARALRELEAHGYLRRTKERTERGQVVTRTVSCNRPGRTGGGQRRTNGPAPRPAKGDGRPPRPEANPPPQRREQREPRRRTALPPVPQPAYSTPDLLRTAIGVLSGLRRTDPRLLISENDAEHLAHGVATWLEREYAPESVHRALTAALPQEPLRRPAALLAHRLTAQLPPLPPFRTPEQPSVRHPLQNCDTCDRAYRAPEPGNCATCTVVTDSDPCSLLVRTST
ncbi:helix-turn-helix domain-containing protein [Streptomyces sp. B6(2022)]|uniref:helix-turn-helix domain-containing protein n=1 Tax=Streptomyces sp. B6(2022) TaxID=3404749 RepID=UPI003AF029ED